MPSDTENSDAEILIRALQASAYVLLNKKQFDEAERLLHQILRIDPEELTAKGCLASIEINRQSESRSLEPLNELIRRYPGKPILTYFRAIESLARGDVEGFMVDCDSSIDKVPVQNDAQLYLLRAGVLEAQGEYARAFSDCNRALQLHPHYDSAFYLRGILHIRFEEPREALEDFRVAEEEGGESSELYTAIGQALVALDENEEGIASFTKAIEVDDSDFDARIYRASVYAALGRFSDALDELVEISRRRQFGAPDFYVLGRLYELKGRNAQAVRTFWEAFKLNPKFPDMWSLLKVAEPDKSILKEWIPILDKIIEKTPTADRAYELRSWFNLVVGKERRAILDISKCIELKPEDVRYYIIRASDYEVRGDFDRARLDYEQVRERRPDIVRVLLYSGRTALMSGNLELAQDYFDKSLQMEPKLVDVYFMRALLKSRQGKFGEAFEELRAIETISDLSFDPWSRFVRAGTSGLTTVTSSSEKVTEIRSYISGIIRSEAGDYQGAIDDLSVALEKDPNHSEARLRRAELQAEQGQASLPSAMDDLAFLIENDPEWNAPLLVRGLIRLRSKLYREAELDFKKALEIDPEEAQTFHLLGLCSIRMGRFHEGRRLLSKASELGYQPAFDALGDMQKVDQEANGAEENGRIKQGPRKRKEMQAYVDAYLKAIEITLKPRPTRLDLQDITGIRQSTWSRVQRTRDFFPLLADTLVKRSKVFESAIKKINKRTEARANTAFESKTITHVEGARDGSTVGSDSNKTNAIDATHIHYLDKDEEDVADQVQRKMDFEKIQGLSEKALRAEILLNSSEYSETELMVCRKEKLVDILAGILGI